MTNMQHHLFMTLGDIIETLSYNTPGTRNEKIEEARKQIFHFPYNAWNDEWKKHFETIFLRHFYFTEIGFETEARFFFELETWLQTNMEYYNKLLKSQLFEAQITNPLSNYDLTENFTEIRNKEGQQNSTLSQDTTSTTDSDTSQNQTASNFNRELMEETPDGRLQITANDGVGVIEYASGINENKSTATQNATATNKEDTETNLDSTGSTTMNEDEVNEHTLTRVGNIGIMTYDQLLNGYRSIFMRIEKQMLEEMRSELFMLVY